MDQASWIKAEKLRIAQVKMEEESVKKLIIKVFSVDGSTKSLMVDEKMTCAYVTKLLARKNRVHMDPKWAIIEHLPDLYMERVYEDHELLVENLMMWTRDSKNMLRFMECMDKIQMFTHPENFLLSATVQVTDFDDHARAMLLEEFFSSTGVRVPEVEGPLYLKVDSKGWKEHHFVLRASGLYYWPKKNIKSSGDLVCLATFDVNQVYFGLGWKKKHNAPTDFCFAIKHPKLQQPKSTKYIKFLCAEDESTLQRWIVGIRIAKYGRHLMDNYRSLVDELAQEDLDLLVRARSCSISSSQPTAPCFYEGDNQASSANVAPTHTQHYSAGGLPAPTNRLRRQELLQSRASSSSAIGGLSDGAPSSCKVGFDCEFPMGVIKHKLSINPKLPLTSFTGQLKEVGETVDGEVGDRCHSPGSGSRGRGTLTRNGATRQSRRCSFATEESGSNYGTLKRHHCHHCGSLDSNRPPPASSSNASTPIRERTEDIRTNTKVVESAVAEDIAISLQLQEESECDYVTMSFALPPPKMFESTPSLDSLLLPQLPSELHVFTDICGSSLSPVSLPPPSLCIDTTTIRRQQQTPTPHSSASTTPTNALSPSTTPTRTHACFSPPPNTLDPPTSPGVPLKPLPIHKQSSLSRQQSFENGTGSVSGSSSHYAVPQYLAELKAGLPVLVRKTSSSSDAFMGTSSKSQNSPATPYSPPCLSRVPKSSILLTKPHSKTAPKKILFNLTPKEFGSPIPPASPTYASSSLNKKPFPSKSSKSTRLSTTGMSPKRLLDADSTLTTPPKDFLKDLRVMQNKWQVAQKCKLDTSTAPHEVLGFPDPPPPIADSRERNVSNCAQEHSGHRDNLYEKVYLVGGNRTSDPQSCGARSNICIKVCVSVQESE